MAALDSPAPAGARQTLSLRSRRGSLTLALLCAVQFLDVADSAIVNVALPSIRRGLGFSQQDLQWVPAAYLLTYGGFLLLGGRLADLYGRRRMLSIGTAVFAAASLAAGAAGAPGTLVTARLVQGLGAALMAPAALAQLTVSFRQSGDRNVALGVWGAVSGMAAAAGVFLGGVFADGPGWRWVFLVNPPLGLAILLAAARLLAADRPARAGRSFDWQGAVLGTGALLAVVYGLVRAPIIGWWSGQTLAALAGAGLLAAWFLRTERRTPDPLVPLAILRVPGLVAADLTQLIAFTGFIGMFFFATLYMQLTPRLVAAAGRRRLPAGHRRFRHRRGHHRATDHPHRHPPGGLRRVPYRRHGHRVALPGPGARHLHPRRAAGVRGHGSWRRRGVRVGHRGGERRRAGRAGRTGGGPAQFLPAAGQRPGPGHPLRGRHHPHRPPAGRRGRAGTGHRRRVPPGPADSRRVDGRRCRVGRAHRQHPRRATRRHGQHGTEATVGSQ
jgi:MFS family permease